MRQNEIANYTDCLEILNLLTCLCRMSGESHIQIYPHSQNFMQFSHPCLQAMQTTAIRKKADCKPCSKARCNQFEGRKWSLDVKDLLVIVVIFFCDASFLQVLVDFEGRAFQTPTSFLWGTWPKSLWDRRNKRDASRVIRKVSQRRVTKAWLWYFFEKKFY